MTMFSTLVGVMELDAHTVGWGALPALLKTWAQDAGGFAALGLFFWVLYVMVSPAPAVAGSRQKMISRFMAITGGLALIAYLVALGLTIAISLDGERLANEQGAGPQAGQAAVIVARQANKLDSYQDTMLAVAGVLALIAFCEPFVLDLLRLRGRRVYAIAKLSFKEAIRRRVVWVFFVFLLIFMFPATWFSLGSKPGDALKTTISVVSYAMTLLLTLTALLLSAFSIPSDIRNQTIHTIVTKPVERFEIVAGRFLGYVGLQTLVLFALTAISLVFILTSNVDRAARAESMRARVPVYGKLEYVRERTEEQRVKQQAFEGIDVGREYAYRKYIGGGRLSSHRAIWSFSKRGQLENLAEMPAVPLEFAFDIYRMTKGLENRGVENSFDITTWKWDPAREAEYQKALRTAFGGYRNVSPDDDQVDPETAARNWEKINAIAEQFGRFEFKNYSVFDYQTYRLMVPPGLLKNALEGDPAKDLPAGSPPPNLIQVKVKCESESQNLGLAPLDLYFLESEGHFWINFFRGAIGLWCRLTIVIGLAVAASTYLAGVVSFLLAFCLFIGGSFRDFLESLAAGNNVGGGPFETFTRLVKGTTTAGELDKTPTVTALLRFDDAFRWGFRRLLNVIPDTGRFTWSKYLEQGFIVDFDKIAISMIFLAGYMLPWLVLAYYLMRSREIAA